jgi:hypothetical protein
MKTVLACLTGMAAAGLVWAGLPTQTGSPVLDSSSTPAGYLSLLLINEVPFPGEKAFRSEADSRAAMQAVLWVLHSRLHHIPPGYKQKEIADVDARNVLDLITARGGSDQVQGFYRDKQGRLRTALRVRQRANYLLSLANQGGADTVRRLLLHAQGLARRYFKGGPSGQDFFVGLERIGDTAVTGRAYAWMTDSDRFHPGGDFVPIPESQFGSLGGNRFYTLEKRSP